VLWPPARYSSDAACQVRAPDKPGGQMAGVWPFAKNLELGYNTSSSLRQSA
jgi:hypothetical protein